MARRKVTVKYYLHCDCLQCNLTFTCKLTVSFVMKHSFLDNFEGCVLQFAKNICKNFPNEGAYRIPRRGIIVVSDSLTLVRLF